jgi:beta-lactamase regulating signal transducer with metallopeptidase domain
MKIDRCTLADGIWDIITHEEHHVARHDKIMKLLEKTFKGQMECCPKLRKPLTKESKQVY